MRHLQRHARVVYLLSIAALFAGGVAQLALTDIRHGESDLTAEWWAVRLASVVILGALVGSVWVLRSILALPR